MILMIINNRRSRDYLCWSCSGIFGSIGTLMKLLSGPKYDGKYLHNLVKELLGQRRLHQALTNVVIPTFDIKNLQPVLFSTYMVCC